MLSTILAGPLHHEVQLDPREARGRIDAMTEGWGDRGRPAARMIGGANGGEAGGRVVAACLLAGLLVAAPGGQGGGVREAWLALREDARPMDFTLYAILLLCIMVLCMR